MKRLLLTGGGGFLGAHLLRVPWPGYAMTAVAHRAHLPTGNHGVVENDLLDHAAMRRMVDRVKPDTVLHLAGLTSPDACERNPRMSQRLNVDTTLALAAASTAVGARFVFTSSDMVFGGATAPYADTDPVCPINRYGCQKAEAEVGVMRLAPAALVVRLPLLFGFGAGCGKNFLETWVHTLKAGRPIKAYSDEVRTPLSAAMALRGLRLAMESNATGIMNLGGGEPVDRYRFALAVAARLGVEAGLVQSARQADAMHAAARPANASLHNTRTAACGFTPPSLGAQLDALLSPPGLRLLPRQA